MKNTYFHTSLESVDELKWIQLIKQSTSPTPFQSPEIYRLFERLENTVPFLVFVEKDNEYLAGTCGFIQTEKGISSYFSRRAIIEGGILLKKGIDYSFFTGIIAGQLIKLLGKKVIYLEIRNYNDYGHLKTAFFEKRFHYLPYLNIHVDCNDIEAVKNRINSSKLRQISRSIKEGAKIITAQNVDQVRDFYNLLEELYLKKVKKPLPDWNFFADFFHSGNGVYLLITFQDKIIGGIMCPYDENAVFEWYITGSHVGEKKIYPSVLATWAAIEFAHKMKIPRFDFMGAGQPEKDYGVRDFKAKFGGDIVENGRFLYIFNTFLYNLGKIGFRLLSKMK